MADEINVNNPANLQHDEELRSGTRVIPVAPGAVAAPIIPAAALPHATQHEQKKGSRIVDSLVGCPGCHPVGTVAGATAGGVAGAVITGMALGSVVGPFGAAFGASAGAAIGAIAGGYAGKGIAESVNPSTEEHYWRSRFASRSYAKPGEKFDDYRDAYAFGVEKRREYPERDCDEMEPELKAMWEAGGHALPWKKACHAVCDAWDHDSPHDRDL